MNRCIIKLITSSSILFGLLFTCSSCSVSKNSDGFVVFEAESLALSPGWEIKKDVPGYTGDGYLQWTGETTFEPGTGLITYPLEVSEAGVYQLNVRCHQGGAIWDAANDMFVQIETAGTVEGYPDISKPEKAYVGSEFDFKLNREERMAARQSLTHDWRWWIWGEEVRSAFRFSLSEGSHVLKIYGRSAGFIIDRLAFFRVEDDSFAQHPPQAFLDSLEKAEVAAAN